MKQLQPGVTEAEKIRFLQEAAINGQFRHPNVVQLMGVVTMGEPVSSFKLSLSLSVVSMPIKKYMHILCGRFKLVECTEAIIIYVAIRPPEEWFGRLLLI